MECLAFAWERARAADSPKIGAKSASKVQFVKDKHRLDQSGGRLRLALPDGSAL